MAKKVITPEDIRNMELDENFNSTNQDPNTRLEEEFGGASISLGDSFGGFDSPMVDSELLTDDFAEDQIELLNTELARVFTDEEDMNEIQADNQTLLGNIGRGALRTVGKIPTEILKGAGTIVGGLGWLASGADTDDMSLIFDNSFNKGVDDTFNAVFEDENAALKTYVPKKIKEGSLLDNLGSSAFWATEGADAVGFFASMLIPGAAVAKTGAGAKLARGLQKLSKFDKLPKFASSALGKASKANMDSFLAAGVNTVIEAGAEGAGTFQGLRDRLITEGEHPEIATQIASEQAAKVFNTNVALLAGPNMMMNKYLFGSFKPKVGAKNIHKAVREEGKRLTGFSTLRNKEYLKDLSGKVLKGVASEGFFEEGLQTATEHYFTQQGLTEKGKVLENSFASDILPDVAGIIKTYGELLPNDVGMQKAIFLGGALGGVGGAFGAYRNYQAAQTKIYGHDGPTTKIGQLVAKTPVSKLFSEKPKSKGLKQVIDENLSAVYATVDDLVVKDDKGETQLNEDGSIKLNPEATKILGEDKTKELAHARMIEKAILDGNVEAAEELINEKQFNIFKDMLESEDSVDYLKEEYIPNESDNLIQTREKYHNQLSSEEYKELSNDEVQTKKGELIDKVDNFKKVYDDIVPTHDVEMNISFENKDNNFYKGFSDNVLTTKLANKTNLEFQKERLTTNKSEIDSLIGQNEFKPSSISKLKENDIIEYNGVKGQYKGEDIFIDFDTLSEKRVVKPKDGDVDLKKLETDKGTVNKIVEKVKAANYNIERQIDYRKNLDQLYDQDKLQSLYDKEVNKYNKHLNKLKVLEIAKPDTIWRNKATGEHIKVKKLGDTIDFYTETINEEGVSAFDKEVSIEQRDFIIDNPDAFTETYDKVSDFVPLEIEKEVKSDKEIVGDVEVTDEQKIVEEEKELDLLIHEEELDLLIYEEELLETNINRVRQVIDQASKKQDLTKSKIKEVEKKVKFLDAVLEKNIEEVSDNLTKHTKAVSNLERTITPLNKEKVLEQIKGLNESKHDIFDSANTLTDSLKELKQSKELLEVQSKDLDLRIQYYTNLLNNENFKVFSKKELESEVSNQKGKLNTLRKLIHAIESAIAKTISLLREITQVISNRFNKLNKFKKRAGVSFKSTKEGLTLVDTNNVITNDYKELKKEYLDLERKVEDSLDYGEFLEDSLGSETGKKEILLKKATAVQNNIRYLEELIQTIQKNIQPTKVKIEGETTKPIVKSTKVKKSPVTEGVVEDTDIPSDLKKSVAEFGITPPDIEGDEAITETEPSILKDPFGDIEIPSDIKPVGKPVIVSDIDVKFTPEEAAEKLKRGELEEIVTETESPNQVVDVTDIKNENTEDSFFEESPTSLKRHIDDMTIGTANNPKFGTTNTYQSNPRPIIADIVQSSFNLPKEGYKLKMMMATNFPKEEAYFNKYAKEKGYKWGETIFGVLVNKDNEFVKYENGELKIIEDQSQFRDNAVIVSLRDADLKFKSSDLVSIYKPDITTEKGKEQLSTILSGEWEKFDGTLNEFVKMADKLNLFEEEVSRRLNNYQNIRNKIIEDLNLGKDITFSIVAKSKGIPNDKTEEKEDLPYEKALQRIGEIENTSPNQTLDNLEVKVAKKETEQFVNTAGTVNTGLGRIYASSKKTGNIYDLTPKKLSESDVNIIVDLFKLYANKLKEGYSKDPKSFKATSELQKLTELDSSGNEFDVKVGNNKLGVLGAIGKLIYVNKDNKNDKTVFGLDKGLTLIMGGTSISGQPVVNRNVQWLNQDYSFKDSFEPTLREFLTKKHYQINSLDLGSEQNIITGVDLKTNTIKTKEVDYTSHILSAYTETNITPKGPITIEHDSTIGGGTSTFEMPALSSVYLKVDFGEYKNIVEPPKTPKSIEVVPSSKEQATKEALQSKREENKKKLDDIEEDFFGRKTSNLSEISKISIPEAKEWFKERFPQFGEHGFYVVKNLVSKGLQGVVYKNAVYIDENAEVGTEYHEAFHIVTQMILPKSEMQSLYSEWKSINKGKTLTTFNGVKKQANKFTDREIEEDLAEDYRDFVLNNGKSKYGNAPTKQSIFRKIIKFIRNLLFNPQIQDVYSRINAGYYANNQLHSIKDGESFARLRVFESEETKYSSHTFADKTMESTNVYFFEAIRKAEGSFETLFKGDNKNIIKDAYDSVKLKFESAHSDAWKEYENLDAIGIDNLTPLQKVKMKQLISQLEDLEFILDQFEKDTFAQFKDIHSTSLRDYGLVTTIEGNSLKDKTPEYDEETIKATNSDTETGRSTKDSGWELADRSIKFSAKMNAQKSIKVLIGSLPQLYYDKSTKTYKRELNSLGLSKTTKFGKMFNSLLSELSGSKAVPEIVSKLKVFRKDVPSVNYFFENDGMQLDKISEADITLSPEKMNEIMQFSQTFAKTENLFSLDLVLEGGLRKILDTNQYTKRTRVDKNWRGNANTLKLEKSDVFTKNGTAYNTKYFRKVKLDATNLGTVLNFLSSIGIDITDINKVQELGLDAELFNIADWLLKSIRKNENSQHVITDANVETDLGGNYNTIIDIEYASNLDLNELSSIGLDGDTRYNQSLNSYISNVVDNLDKFKTFDQMISFYPHLDPKTTPYVESSIILKKGGYLFDNNGNRRKGRDIKLVTLDGARESDNGVDAEFSKLSPADKLAAVLNRATEGQFNMLRPADKKLERFFALDLNVKLKDRNEIFTEYLSDELKRTIKYKQGLSQNNFKWQNYGENINSGILINTLLKHGNRQLASHLNKLLKEDFVNIKKDFNYNGFVSKFITESKDLINEALNNYFDNSRESLFSYMEKNKLIEKNEDGTYIKNGISFSPNKENVTKEDLKDDLDTFVLKDNIMNIEQTKFLFGDAIHFDKVINFFKRTGSYPGTKKLMLADGYTDAWIEENLKRVDNAEGLQDNINAARYLDDTFSRNKAIVKQVTIEDVPVFDKVFGKVKEEADGYSITSLDEYREMLFRTGDWTFIPGGLEDFYQWEMQNYYGDKLSNGEFKKLFKRTWDGKVVNPHDNREITSKPELVLNPLKPLHVGPYAEKGFVPGITKTSFGVLFPSLTKEFPMLEETMEWMRTNKVGVLSFRSANKGADIKTKLDGSLNEGYTSNGNLNLNNLVFEGNKQNAVMQHTYYENWGIQLDTGNKSKDKVITGTQMMKQILSNFSAEGTLLPEFEHLSDTITDYIKLNSERLYLGKQQFLEDFQLTRDSEGKYNINDFSAFKDKLAEIARGKDMNDNILDAIEEIDGDTGVDALLNSDQFEPAIFSTHDKIVIKQDRKGTAAYQIPATFFEKNIREVVDKKGQKYLASSDLKMYEAKKDAKGNIIEVGSMEVYLPDRYKGLVDINKGGKLLEAIGFRIPTQGLASIEAITIKGFLPAEAGDSIVLPSAIVNKAGSDYDIDKLNIYLPNYFINKNNSAEYISSTMDYSDYLKQVDSKEVKLSENKFRKLQVENGITELQRKLILDPSNYSNLITPLDNTLIKDLLVGKGDVTGIYEIVNRKPRDAGNLLDITDRVGLNKKSSIFLESKDAVGITALASPFHILAQYSDLFVDDIYIDDNLKELSTKINMPHNKTKEGKISLGGFLDASDNNIAQSLTSWISEAVDAAKDPRMFDLNVTLDTLNVVLYLTMAGVPTDAILYFLNQPIIRDFIAQKAINQSQIMAVNTVKTPKTFTDRNGNTKEVTKGNEVQYKTEPKTVFDKALAEKLIEVYGNEGVNMTDYSEGFNSKFLRANLEQGYANTKKSSKFNKLQVTFLEDFLRYKDMADKLTSVVQASSWDTNSAGKSVVELLDKTFSVDKALVDGFRTKEGFFPTFGNLDKLLQDEGSFINTYYHNNKILKSQTAPIFKLQLGYPYLRGIYDKMISVLDKKKISNDEKYKIFKRLKLDYLTYLSKTKQYNYDIEVSKEIREKVTTEKSTLLKQVDALIKGKNSVAKRLKVMQDKLKELDDISKNYSSGAMQELKKRYPSNFKKVGTFYQKYKDNLLLRELIAILPDNEGEGRYDHVILPNKKKDLSESFGLTKDWEVMLNDANDSMKQFGLDLFKLTFVQDGTAQSPNGYLKLAPGKVYMDFIKSVIKNKPIDELEATLDITKFFGEFHLMNAGNKHLVPFNSTSPSDTPLVKERKDLKEEYQYDKKTESYEKWQDRVTTAKSRGINVYKDNYPVRKTSTKKGSNSTNPIIQFPEGLYYFANREGFIKNAYGEINELLVDKEVMDLNIFFEIAALDIKSEQGGFIQGTIAEKTKTTGSIPYLEYSSKEGSNLISEQQWKKFSDAERQKSIDCK
ncbi:MAG: hypothetical protein GY775_19270 [Candidatus Scalindua sp.]|nr:hypothetical protein [Candidatus Scalindua sp.]